MTGSNRFRHKGFTLVELIIVIVLLGILSTVAFSTFFSLSTYRERAAYDELAGAVRYAQKLAVASGCAVRINIGSNNYTVQQHVTDCTTGVFTTLVGHPVTSGLFSGVTIASVPASFDFDAMGRSSSAAAITVGSLSFNVIAATGYVDAP